MKRTHVIFNTHKKWLVYLLPLPLGIVLLFDCNIIYANQSQTPANVALIENASFQEELINAHQKGQDEKSQIFHGWTFFSIKLLFL